MAGYKSSADAMSAGDRLRQMSRANERLKDVLRLSYQVGLGAINASLLARRAGTASQGFRVAAAELGNFSCKMDEVMAVVETAIFEAVNAAAGLQKMVRRQQLLLLASKDSTRERELAWVDDSGRNLARNVQNIETGRVQLLVFLNRARVQSSTGRVTARLARLEAVHGGSLAPVMGEAVLVIEETVTQIVEILRELTRQFENARVEKVRL